VNEWPLTLMTKLSGRVVVDTDDKEIGVCVVLCQLKKLFACTTRNVHFFVH